MPLSISYSPKLGTALFIGDNYLNRLTAFLVFLHLIVLLALASCTKQSSNTNSINTSSIQDVPLRVGIAPYQELALLINEKNLGLEKKYNTKIEILTMPWEELLPAVASAGHTIDIGFDNLADYMAKTENLNKANDDPILFLYPAWDFHGGGFVTFNPAVPELNKQNIENKELVKKFFGFKIGVQKNSCCHLLLWYLAHRTGMMFSRLPLLDSTLNDGFLAAQNGSLDIASAGLTQRTEAIKRHGRVVLTMDALNLIDPGGFICKQSTYQKRKKEIESLIRMWYDCSHYVLSDLDHHSNETLAYLKANASTQYTLDEFKKALSQEYIPQSIAEAQKEIVSGKGQYSINEIGKLCNQYLLDIGATKTAQPLPHMITIKSD